MGSSDGGSPTSLAPGFRFHPTDEELVSYYLKRKVCGKPFRFDAISDIEIYKAEPWDLPGLSKLKSRDREWYFFSVLDKKYGNGSRTNRATGEGYWKTTGKDRSIEHKSRLVGMKKTLVFHRGRAPRGERTNWVMHEYRLVDEGVEKPVIPLDGFVLCRIFQKSGTGPKNGEQYGAPFDEEEWDIEDEAVMVPHEIVAADELFINGHDLEQNHGLEFPSEGYAPPLNVYQGEVGNFVQEPTNNVENDLRALTGWNEGLCVLEANTDTNVLNITIQPETEAIRSDYNAQPPIAVSDASNEDQPESQCFDNIESIDEGFFLEANDLLEPIEEHSTDFELDNLMYFDADDDISQYLNFDSSELLDGDLTFSLGAVNEGLYFSTEMPSISNQQPAQTYIVEDASSSKQLKEVPKSKSDSNNPFMKQASHMLGRFPAPSAFASELPTKDMVARLHEAAQSSDLAPVTAGVIKIRNLTVNDGSAPWSFDKSGNLNVHVSFNLPLPESIVSPAGFETLTGVVSGRMASVLSRSWPYFFFFWVMALAISAKVGSCIYAK